MLERFFQISQSGSSIRTEVLAGFTTFLAMSYIIFVNPQILSDAGMDPGAVFVATCLSAAAGSMIMGLMANYPVAIAPGMGLNAFFTYGVVIGLGVPWQEALGAVFLSGCTFIILSLLPIREWIINSIPNGMKLAISSGIGMFLIIIGLRNIGLVVDDPATLVTMGDVRTLPMLLAFLGFLTIVALDALKVPGAVVIGILGATGLGMALGVSDFTGIVALPPDPTPTLFKLDIPAAFNLGMVSVIVAFLFVDMFDTAGTLVGVAHRAGLLDADGRLPRLRRALLADSTATVVGAAFGTSSATSYVESVTGVRAGGRTGLTAAVVALLFLASLFFAPLAGAVQNYATGPALVFAGCVMAGGLAHVDWEDPTAYVPAVVTAIAMPLTYSIATGIGVGFITFAALKILTGRWREANIGGVVLAVLFLIKFIFIDHAS